MQRVEMSRRISAPAPVVWEVMTDLDSAPETISGIESVQRVSGPEFDVGTRWRETRQVFGREATEEMEVSAVEPGRSYTTEADGKGARYTSALTVAPTDERNSEISMSLEAEPTGLGSRILAATLGRLFAGQTKKMIAADLEDIARAAERRAAEAP